MTPTFMQDELGQWHAFAYWRHHYVVGISADKDEAVKRFNEALKVAQT